MLPRPVLLSVGGMVVVAALAGYYLGSRPGLTETDVINAGAAAYARDTGGPITDCVGVPGAAPVWITVVCGAGADAWRQSFDAQGRVVEEVPEG